MKQGQHTKIELPAWSDDPDYEAPLRAASQLPIAPEVYERRRPPEKPMSVAIDAVLKRLGIEASPWLERLAEAWPELAGPVAQKCKPGKFVDGILYVYVANSIDLYTIRRSALPALERAVKEFAGDVEVRQVRVTVGQR